MTKKLTKSIIVAKTKTDNIIGIDGKLPWINLKKDLDYFREHTLNKTIIMGRKTWNSIENKPLEKRNNIVITRKGDLNNDNCLVATGVEHAFHLANIINRDIVIIGGSEIYSQTIALVDELYITEIDLFIDNKIKNITYFPKIDYTQWIKQSSIIIEAVDNIPEYCFDKYMRR